MKELLFAKLQKGNTGVGKFPAIWTILKFIHVDLTDQHICLRVLQIMALSRWTHLVKNHESQSRANISLFIKQQILKY